MNNTIGATNSILYTNQSQDGLDKIYSKNEKENQSRINNAKSLSESALKKISDHDRFYYETNQQNNSHLLGIEAFNNLNIIDNSSNTTHEDNKLTIPSYLLSNNDDNASKELSYDSDIGGEFKYVSERKKRARRKKIEPNRIF